MDPESVLRLKEEAIRLKVEAIELKLESIELKLEAIDLKLEAKESHPGIDASGEDSVVEEQAASVAALTWEQRRDNLIKNLYPRWTAEFVYNEEYMAKLISQRFESNKPTIGDVRSLLEDEREKRACDAMGGGTILHWAVRMKDLALVADILVAGKVDVNATDEVWEATDEVWEATDEVWEATALHWAARIGNTAIVKVMLTNHLASRKFDVRVQDRWEYTALEHCAKFNRMKPNILMMTELLKFKDSDHGYDDREGVIGEVEKILQEGGSSTEVQSRFESQRETWYAEYERYGQGTYLHWAVKMEDTALAAHILAAGKIDVNAIDISHSMHFCSALSLVVQLRNLDIVKLFVAKYLESGNFNVNEVDYPTGYTAIHWAVVSGKEEDTDMVKELLKCEATMRLTEECKWAGKTPLQIAHERGFKDIEKILMEGEVVRRYVEDLYRDRQVYVDAANAILVGAALIASVTFASWLQPPLGYTPDYANVQQHMGLRAFWVFNCLSFYFAIATVVFGARSVLPRSPYFIKRTVEKLRKNLLITAILLACSVFFVIIAFAIAGCIVLTPIVNFQLYMIIPTIFGGLVCLVSLGFLSYSMWEDSLGREYQARRTYEWSNFSKMAYNWIW